MNELEEALKALRAAVEARTARVNPPEEERPWWHSLFGGRPSE